MLRCINFMSCDAGTVSFSGASVGRSPGEGASDERRYDERELTRVRQKVGMVFQQFNLFPT